MASEKIDTITHDRKGTHAISEEGKSILLLKTEKSQVIH